LIRQSGISADKLPEIVRSTDVLGNLCQAAAEQLGLPQNTPVVAGAIDNSAAAVGAGTIQHGDTHIYVGTSSWIGAHVPSKKTHIFSQIASVPCAVNGSYLAVALQSSAGSNLSFLCNRILFPEDEFGTKQPDDLFAVVDRVAQSAPPGSRGLLYTPWIFGERCPVDDPMLRAGWLNLSLQHSRADMIRAVLEGVALNTRWMMTPFHRFVGKRAGSVTLVGGGANSAAWCQIFADVLNIPVRQPRAPIQANAIGAALIGLVGIGALSFNDVPSLIPANRTFVPNSATRRCYDDLFEQFQFAYRRLAPLYSRMNRKAGGRA
jgi:xylulokinase